MSRRKVDRPPAAAPARQSPRYLLWSAQYAAFIVYGSLIPFEYRGQSLSGAWFAFRHIPFLQLGMAFRADWVANLLLYVPLAFLLAGAAAARWESPSGRRMAFGGVFLGCAVLAVGIEFAQEFFPQRTVSLNDIYAEIVGSGLGILLWKLAGARLEDVRRALAARSAQTPRILLALYALAYLGLAVFPFDFLLSRGELAWKVRSGTWGLWLAPNACYGSACYWSRAAEILAALPLGVGLALWRPSRSWAEAMLRAGRWGLALGVLLEAAQFLTASNMSQGVSVLSRVLGVIAGYGLCRSAGRDSLARVLGTLTHPEVLAGASVLYAGLLARLVLAGKGPWLGPGEALHRLGSVHFLPFYYHYFTTEARALNSLLINLGLYAPVGVMAFARRPARRGFANGPWFVAGCGAALAFAVEAAKLCLERSHPDPTNVVVGAVGAMAGYRALRKLSQAEQGGGMAPERESRPWPPGLRAALAGLAALSGLWLLAASAQAPLAPVVESIAEDRTHSGLPPLSELPAAKLPDFRYAHPRFPVPSDADLAKLRRDNPAYLAQAAERARAGGLAVDTMILTAYVQPDAVHLDDLFQRLMGLRPGTREFQHGKALAWAYDWLYPRWTASQRAALADRILAACRGEIDNIRRNKLTPYHEWLYGAPLGAVSACAIALYGDLDEAGPLMNFADDLWHRRVLPVWEQVMGRRGGWHEGGLHLGGGVGRAVYEVPALWRSATGEDAFRSLPGLRGFLDFLVYRDLPDGSTLRWGDVGLGDREIPDRIPLAIEFRNPAAYSLKGCPPSDQPSAWPWGPLARRELCIPGARAALPTERLFDGLGLVVARSGWDPEATVISFKAGDNYWADAQLDQGSFTLYKGGSLIMDSGVASMPEGSDHRMNYAAQTIAHNAVTVTDPDDKAPMPFGNRERPIANDGGQRRVGSGWGKTAAPADQAEWLRRSETYHTGSLLRFGATDGMVLAVADLTPAYTNRSSQSGEFFDRTRRVESLVRTFLYDRVNDVLVVHDRVRSTEADFVKRSLLHMLNRPERTGFGFRVSLPAEQRPGRQGGSVDVHVLWPEEASLDFVGGPGAEFLVDGRNYDEAGRLSAWARGPGLAEAGRWRVEISPRHAALRDEFLMVLVPRRAGKSAPELRVRKNLGATGCAIAGPQRSLAVAFPAGSSEPRVELDGRPVRW